MKINWFFKPQLDPDQVDIYLHPSNHSFMTILEKYSQKGPTVEVIVPQTSRKKTLQVTCILAIESMDHLSKVYTLNEEVVYLKGRLKELTYLADFGLVRISNTTILNLTHIESFQTEANACLSVYMKQGQRFRVSRHYVKNIRKRLSEFHV